MLGVYNPWNAVIETVLGMIGILSKNVFLIPIWTVWHSQNVNYQKIKRKK